MKPEYIDFITINWKYFLIGFLVYFFPSFISYFNNGRGRWGKIGFFLVNLFLGWTIYFWFKLLFRSLSRKPIFKSFGNSEYDISQDDVPKKKSRGNSKNNSVDSDDDEGIQIQYQSTGGNWMNYSCLSGTDSYQISQGLKIASRGVSNKPNANGRVRAIGMKSGRLYDMS
jgi:hypothetical protein